MFINVRIAHAAQTTALDLPANGQEFGKGGFSLREKSGAEGDPKLSGATLIHAFVERSIG